MKGYFWYSWQKRKASKEHCSSSSGPTVDDEAVHEDDNDVGAVIGDSVVRNDERILSEKRY